MGVPFRRGETMQGCVEASRRCRGVWAGEPPGARRDLATALEGVGRPAKQSGRLVDEPCKLFDALLDGELIGARRRLLGHAR